MNAKKPVALVILDGFGYRKDPLYNAIHHARKPFIDFLFATYPHTLLEASGPAVGLPPGFMGNSEVGHLTIGSGRIIPQPVTRLHNAINDGSFFANRALKDALDTVKKTGGTLHIMGLLSESGVHSHDEDLFAFMRAARDAGIKNVVIHAFLDGRDAPPRSASLFLQKLETVIKELGVGTIGSVHGRWYAMDRNHNWDRTEKSYVVLTTPQKPCFSSWREVLDACYKEKITDEFVPPASLGAPAITDGDGIIFFNFRPDRARQLTRMFIDTTLKNVPQPKLCSFLTPVSYGLASLSMTWMFDSLPVPNTLKEVLVAHDKSIFTIAETEKYAHVTYFFSGGKEEALHHEIRLLIPSLPVKTYADYPEMSAPQITQTVIKSLSKSPKDFYLINYANADMVGHSGNFKTTVKAIECLDTQLSILYENIVETLGGTMIVTADHGNAELMEDASGHPKTSHTNSPVPFIVTNTALKNNTEKLPLHQLADIAPYVLALMHVPAPPEMSKGQPKNDHPLNLKV